MNDPESVPENTAEWEEACRREEAIRRFVQRRADGSQGPPVKELARELDLSRATTYRMIKSFEAGCTVTSLLGRSPGRPRGHLVLDPKREALIRETIESFYLKPTKPTIARLVQEIRTRCLALGLAPPNWRTVKARVVDLDLRAKARKRGEVALLKLTLAVPGEYRASRPLEIVQIDHTKVDLIVVDEQTREPLDRPWITIAMDVFTRMVTGFYLTMDDRSCLSVSLCLLQRFSTRAPGFASAKLTPTGRSLASPNPFTQTTARTFAVQSLHTRMPRRRNRHHLAPAGHAPLRRPYRAIDRHPDGRSPSSARNHPKQSGRPR